MPAVAAGAFLIPASRNPDKPRIDVASAARSILAIVPFAASSVQGSARHRARGHPAAVSVRSGVPGGCCGAAPLVDP